MAVAGFLHYTKSTKQALQDLRNSSSKLRPTLRSLPIWHRSRTLSCAEQMTSAVEAFETWSFLAMIRLVQGCRGGIPFSFCGESACLIFTGWVNHGESPRPCEYRCEYEYKQFPGKPAAEVSYKNNLTYRSVPSHMPCGPPFFPARSGTVHAVASSFAFHRWFTATHRSPRAQPLRHRLTTSFFPHRTPNLRAQPVIHAQPES